MPIFGIRFEGGLKLQDQKRTMELVISNIKKAKTIHYPPGRYDVTPNYLLWPELFHFLHVFKEQKTSSDRGVYITKPADESTVIIDSSKIEDIFTQEQANQKRSYLGPGSSPIVIARPEIEYGKTEIYLLLVLLFAAENIFPAPQFPQPEVRRNLLSDIQDIFNASDAQNYIPQEIIIRELVKLGTFYSNKSISSLERVLEHMASLGHLTSTSNGATILYGLGKKK